MKLQGYLLLLSLVLSTPAFCGDLQGIIQIAVGGYSNVYQHACALAPTGVVHCWGSNSQGQLGRGTLDTFERLNPPAAVVGLGTATYIAASGTSSCAVTSGGAVKCWGHRYTGDGGNVTDATPREVPGLSSGIAAVAGGGFHGCALTTSGGVKCWGRNQGGHVGDGTFVDRFTAVDVVGLASDVVSIAVKGVACAVTVAGAVKCWGSFSNLPGFAGGPTPALIPGMESGFVAVTVGDTHLCAVTSAGAVKCRGFNWAGQLGDGTTTDRSDLVDVVGLASGVTSIAAGDAHNCAVQGGASRCWGMGFWGQMGDGFFAHRSAPVSPTGLSSGVVAMAGGGSYICALLDAGRVSCWGGAFIGTPVLITLPAAPQTVSFEPLAIRDLNDPAFTVAATASSGLAVQFTTDTPWVCSLSGSTVTMVEVGICNVAARQPGNDDFSAAEVRRSFRVSGLKPTSPTRLANISTRAQVRTDHEVLIGGFVINGPSAKTVIVRARGPSLASAGVANPLPDPTLALYSGQTVIESNDNWGAHAGASAIESAGYAPAHANESAILATLQPGGYTAIVRNNAGTPTGVGIVEVFEVDRPQTPLVNIATRGAVLTGEDVMIGGFIVHGNSPQTVVVRARGPTLQPFGIDGFLADPRLQLVRSSDQSVIVNNDDWQSASNAAAITASGFAPANAKESAILVTLDPGAYTAVVSGVGNTTGIGLIEVFAVR